LIVTVAGETFTVIAGGGGGGGGGGFLLEPPPPTAQPVRMKRDEMTSEENARGARLSFE
jgi:hypothetical protein